MFQFWVVESLTGDRVFYPRLATPPLTHARVRAPHMYAQELRGTRGDLGLLLAVSRGINAAVHLLVSYSEQLQVCG